MRLFWREIRPDAGKTIENKFVASFLSIDYQNSCAADELACVFGSCALNKHSVLKIFMTKGGFLVMEEPTRNHIFSKEINQVIIVAMVLAPNF